jgi:hypothetical protein
MKTSKFIAETIHLINQWFHISHPVLFTYFIEAIGIILCLVIYNASSGKALPTKLNEDTPSITL